MGLGHNRLMWSATSIQGTSIFHLRITYTVWGVYLTIQVAVCTISSGRIPKTAKPTLILTFRLRWTYRATVDIIKNPTIKRTRRTFWTTRWCRLSRIPRHSQHILRLTYRYRHRIHKIRIRKVLIWHSLRCVRVWSVFILLLVKDKRKKDLSRVWISSTVCKLITVFRPMTVCSLLKKCLTRRETGCDTLYQWVQLLSYLNTLL